MTPPSSLTVLGIDPGTASTGYGVVAQTTAGDFELLACGVIRTQPSTAMHLRLLEIFQDVDALIHEFQPDALAVEKLFFSLALRLTKVFLSRPCSNFSGVLERCTASILSV